MREDAFRIRFHKTENGFITYQGGYEFGEVGRERVALDFDQATKEATLMFKDWLKTQKEIYK